MKRTFFTLFTALVALCATAKADKLIEVAVSPAGGSWTVETGDKIKFDIFVTESNIPAEGSVEYELSEDLMTPFKKGTIKLSGGQATVSAGTMKRPGFLRCKAIYKSEKETYTGMGTVGFSPDKITPATSEPADFDEFWSKTLAQARAKELKPLLQHIPELSTPDIDVYRASWNAGTSRFYGMLAIPKGDGPFPAVVQYPGAGVYRVGPNMGFAEKGVISLAFHAHGMMPDLDDKIYTDLGNTALREYPTMNIVDRDRYYYRRMVQGAVRAIDFLEQLPQCNGRIATYGGSQGGFLSAAVAALHPSVSFAEIRFPALSDMAGYTKGRAGGWPHALKNKDMQTPQIIENLSYYDTVNFARRIKAPVAFAFGYNDLTCAPTTTQAVYNTISSPKTLFTAPLMGHATTTEQTADHISAVVDALKK